HRVLENQPWLSLLLCRAQGVAVASDGPCELCEWLRSDIEKEKGASPITLILARVTRDGPFRIPVAPFLFQFLLLAIHSLSAQFAFPTADRRVGRLGLRAAQRERPEVSDFDRFCPAGKDFARSRVTNDAPNHPRLGNSRKNCCVPRRRRAPRTPHCL